MFTCVCWCVSLWAGHIVLAVFIVVLHLCIFWECWHFSLCKPVFGPQFVFVMSRTCNNVESDSSLSSKHDLVLVSIRAQIRHSGFFSVLTNISDKVKSSLNHELHIFPKGVTVALTSNTFGNISWPCCYQNDITFGTCFHSISVTASGITSLLTVR